MQKYAVIQLAGKQFQVSEGDKLTIDMHVEDKDKLLISDVLLVADEKSKKIGTPIVEKAQVELKVIELQKGDKIRVAKFKAKSRYRKVRGHRQPQTVLEVSKITA